METSSNTSLLQNQALSLGAKLVPFLIFAIHFSPPITIALTVVIALLWTGSGHFRNATLIINQIPAVFYGLLFLAVMAISISYSSAPFEQALGSFSKYRKFLLLLILVPFLATKQSRTKCEFFLLTALIATLLISYIGHLAPLFKALIPYLDAHRITHSIYIAFLGFYSLHKIYDAPPKSRFWGLLLALTVINLFFVSDGRTGQLCFLFLCGLFFLQAFSVRIGFLMIIAILIAFTLFLFFAPTTNRFMEGITNSIDFFNNNPAASQTSMGFRLRFWSNALTIIGQSPWLGEGIGGFPYAFHTLFPDYPILDNPHNEYLLITSQLGLLGLFLFLIFLTALLRQSTKLPKRERQLLQGIWVMLCISCLFNSSIFDYAEGHWFMTMIALYSAPLLSFPTCLASSSSHATNPNT